MPGKETKQDLIQLAIKKLEDAIPKLETSSYNTKVASALDDTQTALTTLKAFQLEQTANEQ